MNLIFAALVSDQHLALEIIHEDQVPKILEDIYPILFSNDRNREIP